MNLDFKQIIKKIKRNIGKSRVLPFVVVLAMVLLVGVFVVRGYVNNASSSVAASDKRIAAENPKAQENLSKIIFFSVKDDSGHEVTKVRYEIVSAELRDQIIVKGQRATAVQGKTFLILNVKIKNDYDKPMQINAKDYVRLIVNGSSEKLAPEIHNDPVEVQALSTKYTRVGFPINDQNRSLILQVGEIGGKKEDIPLSFK